MLTKEQQRENRRKWVEALRSGEFMQGQRRLAYVGEDEDSEVRHCCLGVACELAIREGVAIERTKHFTQIAYSGEAIFLPLPVQEWLGLRHRNGNYNGTSLSTHNDGGAAFDEIADIIESEPEGLVQ